MTENKSLVDLTNEYQQLIILLQESGGEINSEIDALLTVNQELIAKKADKYNHVINRLEAEELYWKSEADKYAKVSKACGAARERLRSYIKNTMIAMDAQEITGENIKFKLRPCAPKLVIDENILPPECFMVVTSRTPDKDHIKEFLKAGGLVKGAHLEPVVALTTTISRKA